jgi:predicted GNAT superfamily acetyltransferase
VTLHIERVTSVEACESCLKLAEVIWGGGVACSAAQMTIHANYGGVVLLAYDEGDPIGFLFSFPALYRGENVLWSHETGLLPAYLHRGVGFKLKQTQRSLAAELGYRNIVWTFDPLVSRNAYFNIVKLGAHVDAYKVNAYGADETDLINQGVETDRFIAVWPVAPSETAAITTPDDAVDRTDIPLDFTELLRQDAARARALRYRFRETALTAFEQGLRPAVYRRTPGGGQYLWTKEASPSAN